MFPPPEKDLRTKLDKLRDMARLGTEHEREVARALLERIEAKAAEVDVRADGVPIHGVKSWKINFDSNPMSAPPRTKPPVRHFTSAYEMFQAGVRPKPIDDNEVLELFQRIFGEGVTKPPEGTKVYTWVYDPKPEDDE